jgi:hypothetical protein
MITNLTAHLIVETIKIMPTKRSNVASRLEDNTGHPEGSCVTSIKNPLNTAVKRLTGAFRGL